MIETIKKYVTYVLVPVTLLFGFIYYLLQQISTLKTTVSQAGAETALQKTEQRYEELKKDDQAKEDAFNKQYADYFKRNKPS